ncbi:uncharacterized protein LOC118386470 [Oncorhynchus keta]|uniref:uncharacterized protein LOC118386470 n=1 Tax=Oncorhynchus keta TaxID=8018 RepID=UPI0015F7A693|nr:uncharacterized protein LOC118386470 [Oncorhynchus keta]
MFVTAFLTFEIPLTSLSEAKLYDGSGTEVDGNVFEEAVTRPNLGVLKLTLYNDAKGWDNDLSSILLLLHLTPPSSQGRKRPGKMSASQAEQYLVIFQKSGTSIQEHLDAIDQSRQPYLLAVGTRKSSIHAYFIILDKRALPCKSMRALVAFDELCKTHFVFGTAYNRMLRNMYTFIQTIVYNIDIGKVKETPRVVELRAFLKMELTLIWKMDYI